MTASHDQSVPPPSVRPHSRTSNASSLPEPATALRTTSYDVQRLAPASHDENRLPSPRPNLAARLRETSRPARDAGDRKTGGLAVEIVETMYVDVLTPGPTTSSSRADSVRSPAMNQSRNDTLSPSLTEKSNKSKAIDEYISSVEQARSAARHERTSSRRRDDNRGGRTASRAREPSASRGRDNVRYIKSAKRSPASPVPMSPEEIAKAGQQQVEPATTDDEEFYKLASPITSPAERYLSPVIARPESRQARTLEREGSRHRVAAPALDGGRGRSAAQGPGLLERSPSMPMALSPEKRDNGEIDETESNGRRFRIRAASANRNPDDLQSREPQAARVGQAPPVVDQRSGRRRWACMTSPERPSPRTQAPCRRTQTHRALRGGHRVLAVENWLRRSLKTAACLLPDDRLRRRSRILPTSQYSPHGRLWLLVHRLNLGTVRARQRRLYQEARQLSRSWRRRLLLKIGVLHCSRPWACLQPPEL